MINLLDTNYCFQMIIMKLASTCKLCRFMCAMNYMFGKYLVKRVNKYTIFWKLHSNFEYSLIYTVLYMYMAMDIGKDQH